MSRAPVAGFCRAAILTAAAFLAPAHAQDPIDPPSRGQTVYVPVYAEARPSAPAPNGKADAEGPRILVTVRNTDPKDAIRVVAAPYFDTAGKMIRDQLAQPRSIGPFSTLEIAIEPREGENGANIAVRWEASRAVSPPIIEALHLRTQSGMPGGFISRGKVISTP